MNVLAAQTFSRAHAGQRPVGFPMIERPPVLIAQSQLAFQHLADEPGDRRVLLGRLAPSHNAASSEILMVTFLLTKAV